MSLKQDMLFHLAAWEKGEVDERFVHEWAEQELSTRGWRDFPADDPRAIEMEVLGLLEILNHELVIRKDVPEILAFLRTVPGEEPAAWARWRQYWNMIDFEARRQELADRQYYCT